MIIDLERWVEFLHKTKLTPSQYAFLAIMHEKQFKLIYKLKESNDKVVTKQEVQDLVDQGYIYNWNDEGVYALDQFEMTPEGIELFEKNCEWVCAEAFIKAYPRWLFIQGKQVPARSCNLEQLEREYYQKVVKRGDHQRVMDQLLWAVKNHKISMGIEKWFLSRQWEAIEEMRDTTSNVILPADRELQ